MYTLSVQRLSFAASRLFRIEILGNNRKTLSEDLSLQQLLIYKKPRIEIITKQSVHAFIHMYLGLFFLIKNLLQFLKQGENYKSEYIYNFTQYSVNLLLSFLSNFNHKKPELFVPNFFSFFLFFSVKRKGGKINCTRNSTERTDLRYATYSRIGCRNKGSRFLRYNISVSITCCFL